MAVFSCEIVPGDGSGPSPSGDFGSPDETARFWRGERSNLVGRKEDGEEFVRSFPGEKGQEPGVCRRSPESP